LADLNLQDQDPLRKKSQSRNREMIDCDLWWICRQRAQGLFKTFVRDMDRHTGAENGGRGHKYIYIDKACTRGIGSPAIGV